MALSRCEAAFLRMRTIHTDVTEPSKSHALKMSTSSTFFVGTHDSNLLPSAAPPLLDWHWYSMR